MLTIPGNTADAGGTALTQGSSMQEQLHAACSEARHPVQEQLQPGQPLLCASVRLTLHEQPSFQPEAGYLVCGGLHSVTYRTAIPLWLCRGLHSWASSGLHTICSTLLCTVNVPAHCWCLIMPFTHPKCSLSMGRSRIRQVAFLPAHARGQPPKQPYCCLLPATR